MPSLTIVKVNNKQGVRTLTRMRCTLPDPGNLRAHCLGCTLPWVHTALGAGLPRREHRDQRQGGKQTNSPTNWLLGVCGDVGGSIDSAGSSARTLHPHGVREAYVQRT